MPAVAADLTTGPSAQTKVEVKTAIPLSLSQLAKPKTPVNYQVERLGNISSQPWDKVAGEPPAPLFESQREYVDQPNFALIWMGNAPQ